MTGRTDAGSVAPSTAAIQRMIRAGDHDGAASAVAALVEAGCGRAVGSVTLTLDEYSLNSVSGRVRFEDGTVEFFKFHHEEGEERNVSEYYRARLLLDAGLQVEVPLAVVTEPGRQIVLYEVRNEPRLADVCADLERKDGTAARLPPHLATARRALDAAIGSVMAATARGSGGTCASAAIHQLFHHRLTDGGRFPGGRYRAWYLEDPAFERVADRRFRINGVTYDSTPRQLARRAAALLDPEVLATGPVVTAHGDDHHGSMVAAAYGGSPTGILSAAGALGPFSTAVHAAPFALGDVFALGRTDSGFCMCQTTERSFGDGIGPAAALAAVGVPFSLGSDSQAVIDPLEEARTLELDQRQASGWRGHLSAAQLLAAAAESEQQRVIGWDGAGCTAPGAWADLVTISMDSPCLSGADPGCLLERAVFSAGSHDVTEVVVSGRPVVSGGHHLLVPDVADALRSAMTEVTEAMAER